MLRLRAFVRDDLAAVEPWFDDDTTIRWLGGREWPRRLLALLREPPPEARVRIAWLAVDGDVPVGVIDVEIYADATASTALVVDPARRGRGHGREILELACRALAPKGIRELRGWIEPGNEASRRCALAAGFRALATVDADGFIPYVRALA